MASEILRVPEEHLLEVVKVLRAGLKAIPEVSSETRNSLNRWCNDIEEYMKDGHG